MYWNELTKRQKIVFILEVTIGVLLFFWLPGVLLGIFAAVVIILGFRKIF